jgi:ELWxxDGT repeat protein
MNAALGRVFFPADSGASGLEPWSTDGTPGGAAPLGDLNRADGGSNPADFVAGPGNTFYFSATPAGQAKQVWVSDGTPGNTRPLVDPDNSLMPVTGSPVAYLNGKLFVSNIGLWSTDGTVAGTRRLAQSASSPVEFNGLLYFVSHDNGNRLYRTDGTVEGTAEVNVNHFSDPEVFPDNPILYPTALPTRLLFQRNYLAGGTRMALFSTDGTSAGTVPLLTHSDPAQLAHAAVMGGKAYLPMNGALWVTDGTPEGTRHVVDAPFIRSITAAGDRLFYVSNGALWVSDGTAEGTRPVGTTVPTPGTADEALMTAYGRNVVFESGGRAWISDGTPQGTRRLWDEAVVKLPESRATRPFAVWQGRLYFLVSRAGNRTALVRSDGTPEGTIAEADLPAVTSSAATAPPNSTLHAVGDHLVAVLRDARFGREPFAVGPPQPLTASVAARHVFYNGSAFDFDRTTPSAFDDDAIARDKRPALPGEVPTFANLTSYSRGINGIMVDVRNLPGTPLDASDFAFRVAGGANPSAWDMLAAQPTVTVRRRAGVDGTDRVTLIWPEGAVRNAWLEVTLLATPRTHLAVPDTFIFGNLVGETGSAAGSAARVDAADAVHTRAARTAPGAVVAVTSRHDINRDGVVNVLDELLVRRNVGRSLPPPTLPPAGVTAAPAPRVSTRRSAYDRLTE